jgi:hypothetical protein
MERVNDLITAISSIENLGPTLLGSSIPIHLLTITDEFDLFLRQRNV